MSELDYNLATRRYWRLIQMLWIRLAVVLVCGMVFALLAYKLGQSGAEAACSKLERSCTALTHTNADLKQISEQQGERIRELEQLKQDQDQSIIQHDIPVELAALIRQRIDEGVSAEQLRFYINQGSLTGDCGQPENKRFLVKTSLHRPDASRVRFDDGKGSKLAIAGSGSSATSADGRPEAWFDPLKSVNIEVTVARQRYSFSGVLPLSQVVVAGDIEYRFSLDRSALTKYRSFARASLTRCVIQPPSP